MAETPEQIGNRLAVASRQRAVSATKLRDMIEDAIRAERAVATDVAEEIEFHAKQLPTTGWHRVLTNWAARLRREA